MTDDLSRLLVRELETFAREVELFPDDESLFKTLPGVANSAGSLGLHVCGNLQHFVGAVLGGTGYVRNRDAEFAARAGRRDDLVRKLRETAAVVASTLGQLPQEALARPYPEPVAGVQLPCGRFLMHLARAPGPPPGTGGLSAARRDGRLSSGHGAGRGARGPLSATSARSARPSAPARRRRRSLPGRVAGRVMGSPSESARTSIRMRSGSGWPIIESALPTSNCSGKRPALEPLDRDRGALRDAGLAHGQEDHRARPDAGATTAASASIQPKTAPTGRPRASAAAAAAGGGSLRPARRRRRHVRVGILRRGRGLCGRRDLRRAARAPAACRSAVLRRAAAPPRRPRPRLPSCGRGSRRRRPGSRAPRGGRARRRSPASASRPPGRPGPSRGARAPGRRARAGGRAGARARAASRSRRPSGRAASAAGGRGRGARRGRRGSWRGSRAARACARPGALGSSAAGAPPGATALPAPSRRPAPSAARRRPHAARDAAALRTLLRRPGDQEQQQPPRRGARHGPHRKPRAAPPAAQRGDGVAGAATAAR